MRKHFNSLAAVLVMVLLACGSVDTSTVNNRTTSNVGIGGESAATPSDSDGGRSSSQSPTVHKMNESVHVGYTSYIVWKAIWSNRLSANEYLDQRPNASYLIVQLSVRNDDTQARMVPPFKLIDENNSEYEASPNSWVMKESIGALESLNPNVSKQGLVVFDVPRERKYRLKISGGYWSTEDAFIEIAAEDPEASKLAQQQAVERQQREAQAEQLAAQEKRNAEIRDEQQKRKAEQRVAQEKRKAAIEAAKWRTWHSANGKFSKEAKFLKAANGVVTLEYKDGKTTEIPMGKLSDEDQDFIRNRAWMKVP